MVKRRAPSPESQILKKYSPIVSTTYLSSHPVIPTPDRYTVGEESRRGFVAAGRASGGVPRLRHRTVPRHKTVPRGWAAPTVENPTRLPTLVTDPHRCRARWPHE